MRISPLQVFLSYLLVIVVCAIAYCFVPGIFSDQITFLDSAYFSVITITTLGYGDLSPISDFGKILAGCEALLGVVLLGVFFLTVSHQLVDTQERKRINASIENLKVQYRYWRRDTVWSLLFLSTQGSSVSSELADKLVSPNKFRDYFTENDRARWYSVANNLSKDDYYTRGIVKGLERLQNHIETFIAIVPISEPEVLRILTNYADCLDRMRCLDLDDYEGQKSFMSDLWSIVALWDFATGEFDRDYLLETIEKI
jgi:Ca2+/Na+ antiporter